MGTAADADGRTIYPFNAFKRAHCSNAEDDDDDVDVLYYQNSGAEEEGNWEGSDFARTMADDATPVAKETTTTCRFFARLSHSQPPRRLLLTSESHLLLPHHP